MTLYLAKLRLSHAARFLEGHFALNQQSYRNVLPVVSRCTVPYVQRMELDRWSQIQKEFDRHYSDFEELLLNCVHPETSKNRLIEVVNYNIPGGKRIRGCLVPASLEAFSYDESLDSRYLQHAHLIGWCIEMLHSGFLIHDDLMDNAPTRRNKTSWFLLQKQAGHGLIAVNDGLHLMLTTKFLLHQLFLDSCAQTRGYLKLLQLFDEVTYRTCWGQTLDSECAKTASKHCMSEPLNVDTFTRSNFDQITKWKTGFYTFYLPVACGMAIAGITDETVYSNARMILLKLGQYFQAQDDYLDCFGDESVIGKVGTDIADGKCSWLIVECLERASAEQIQTIQLNYGRQDPSAQAAVRDVYKQLNLPNVFADYETQMRKEIMRDIAQWTLPSASVTNRIQQLFFALTDLLFRRTK